MKDKNILNACATIYTKTHTRSSSTYRTLIITMVLPIAVLIVLILERITTSGVKFNSTYSAQLATHTHTHQSVYDE